LTASVINSRRSGVGLPLLGRREPRVRSVPDFAETVGDGVVKFAADAGLFLDGWQQDVLLGSMGLRPSGAWAARHVGLLVPRQNGKGSILEARELFGMFASDERLIIHSAHKYDTSQKHFARILALIEGNPDLDRHIKRLSRVSGKESVELKDGTLLQFKARTVSGSARGFTGDLIVLDEAMYLPEEAVDAMLPTTSAVPNPQTWVTSSAGNKSSGFLWRIVQRGRAGHPSMAYFEWGTPLDADVSDRQVWADANPALGIRVQMEALEDDFDLMSDEGFAREHLGVWDDPSGEALIDVGRWAELLAEEGPGSPQVFAVDASLDGAVTVAGAGDGFVQVYGSHAGTGWVTDRCLELDKEFLPSVWVMDEGGAAAWLIPELQDAGLNVVGAKSAQVAAAAAQFVDAVARGTVRHGRDAGLDAAIGGCRPRQFRDGGFFFGRRVSSVDVAPLVAVTLAYWGWSVYGAGLAPGDVYVGF
jgi:hypothetical protein